MVSESKACFELSGVPFGGVDGGKWLEKLGTAGFSVVYDFDSMKSQVVLDSNDLGVFGSAVASVPGFSFRPLTDSKIFEPLWGLRVLPMDKRVFARHLRGVGNVFNAVFDSKSFWSGLASAFRGQPVQLVTRFVPVVRSDVEQEKSRLESSHPVSKLVKHPWLGVGLLLNPLGLSEDVLQTDARLMGLYDALLSDSPCFRASVFGGGDLQVADRLKGFFQGAMVCQSLATGHAGCLLSCKQASALVGFYRDFASEQRVVDCAPLGSDVLQNGVELGFELLSGLVLGRSVRMPLEALNLHAVVSGLQGSGKTSLVFGLADAAVKAGKKVVVLSPAKEWTALVRENKNLLVLRLGQTPVNLVRVPIGTVPSRFFEALASLLTSALNPGPYSGVFQNCLLKSFRKLYAQNASPSLVELCDVVEAEIRLGFGKSGKYVSNLQSCVDLLRMIALEGYSVPDGLKIEDCVDRCCVFDFSNVSDLFRPVLTALVLGQVNAVLLSRFGEQDGSGLKSLVVLEEAQKVFQKPEWSWMSGGNVASEDLAQQLGDFRKHGIGVVFVTHFVDRLNPALVRHANCHFVFKQDSQGAQEAVKRLALDASNDFGFMASSKSRISTLGVGECGCLLVDSDRQSVGPFFLKTKTPQKLVGLSDREVAWRANEVLRTYSRFERRFDYGFSDDEKKLLIQVVALPLLSVSERLANLGWSVDLFLKVRRGLIRQGLVVEESFVVGKNRKTFVVLSEKGLAKMENELPDLDLSFWKSTSESFQHRYWKQIVAEKLKKEGFQVAFEVPVDGGFVDVVGTKEGKRLAVEVEVSGSQAEQNVEKCVKADFDDVRVVCVRKPVFLRLEEYVRAKGLEGVMVKMGCEL